MSTSSKSRTLDLLTDAYFFLMGGVAGGIFPKSLSAPSVAYTVITNRNSDTLHYAEKNLFAQNIAEVYGQQLWCLLNTSFYITEMHFYRT